MSINSSGLYIESNLFSTTVLGYLNTCTSNLQSQLDSKQIAGSNATKTWVHNQGYLTSQDVNQFLNKNGDTIAGTLQFSTARARG